VPRSSNAGNMRAAFTVAQAITWLSGMPNIRKSSPLPNSRKMEFRDGLKGGTEIDQPLFL
jgi:hypothetical protein